MPIKGNKALVVDRVVDMIRGRVVSGEFGFGGRLPSSYQLVEQTLIEGSHPSHQTVVLALNILLSSGELVKQRQSYYVSAKKIRIPLFSKNFADHIRSLGLEPLETNLINPEFVSADDRLAGVFDVSPGASLVHRKRRQGSLMQTMRTAENWYPLDLAGGFLEAMQNDSAADVLEMIKEKHGVYVTSADDYWFCRPPTPDEIKVLMLPRFNWVVDLEHILRAEDGRVVLYNKTIANANFCDFSISYGIDYWR